MCAFEISRRPHGTALVIVLLVMAVLLLAGTTFLTISSTESQIALNERASAAAQALAEAAVHKAIAILNADPTYPGEANTALGGGTFTVTVAPAAVQGCPGNTAKDLTAMASVPVGGGQAQTQIEVMVDRVSYPYRWALFAAVPNEIVTPTWGCPSCNVVFGANRQESELWLAEHTSVDSFDSGVGLYDGATNSGQSGNIGANGDITIDHNSTINGNVTAGDTLHRGSGADVSGTVTTGVSPHRDSQGEAFPTPTVPGGASRDLDVRHGTTTLEAGTHVFRNMVFTDGASLATTGSVRIYVTGTVSIGNDVTLGSHPATQLQIITKSDGPSDDAATFQAGSGFKMYGSLFGKNTDVKLGTDAQAFGSIIGRTLYVQSRGKIHYDQAMFNQTVCTNGKFTILRGTWREAIPSAR